MQSHLQGVEVEGVAPAAVNLTVHHRTGRQLFERRVMELWKVPIERPKIAALNEHVRIASKDDGPETVPFRLVEKVASRDRFGNLGQHGFHRGSDWKVRHRRELRFMVNGSW